MVHISVDQTTLPLKVDEPIYGYTSAHELLLRDCTPHRDMFLNVMFIGLLRTKF